MNIYDDNDLSEKISSDIARRINKPFKHWAKEEWHLEDLVNRLCSDDSSVRNKACVRLEDILEGAPNFWQEKRKLYQSKPAATLTLKRFADLEANLRVLSMLAKQVEFDSKANGFNPKSLAQFLRNKIEPLIESISDSDTFDFGQKQFAKDIEGESLKVKGDKTQPQLTTPTNGKWDFLTHITNKPVILICLTIIVIAILLTIAYCIYTGSKLEFNWREGFTLHPGTVK